MCPKSQGYSAERLQYLASDTHFSAKAGSSYNAAIRSQPLG